MTDGLVPADVPADLRQPEARAFRGAARRRGRLAGAITTLVVGLAALAAGRLAGALGDGLAAASALAVALLVAVELATLPVALRGHAAALAHGLSRQDVRGALADRAKGVALVGALLAAAAPALLALQRALPDGWPLAAAAAWLGVEVLLALAFPVLILPRFLRSEPLPDGPLRAMALATSARAEVPVVDVRLLRLGEKTRAGNAMVVGLGPTRRILLGDTLAGVDGAPGDAAVDAGRLAEAAAVLAHELAHHRHRDILRGLALALATTPLTLLVAAAVLARLPEALAHGGAGEAASVPALAAVLAVAGLPASLVTAWHSRRRERAADALARRVGGPQALAQAFARLAADGLAELEPPLLGRPLASHPPLAERIDACRREAA